MILWLYSNMQCSGITAKGTQCTRAPEPGCVHCKTHRRTTTAKASHQAAANARRAEQERLFSASAAAPVSDPIIKRGLKALGLSPSVRNRNMIRKAYHEKARATHPDRGGLNADFKEIQKAYEALKERLGL